MNIEETIKSKIDQGGSFNDVLQLLREFKNNGGSQNEAVDALTHLMQEYRKAELTDQEDLVFDLLDRASGFTHESNRIW